MTTAHGFYQQATDHDFIGCDVARVPASDARQTDPNRFCSPTLTPREEKINGLEQ
jgi:hypothetical protein